MSDHDWEFSGADDAKAEIRAAVRYLLQGTTDGIRGAGDHFDRASGRRRVAARAAKFFGRRFAWRIAGRFFDDFDGLRAHNCINGTDYFSERYGATSLTFREA